MTIFKKALRFLGVEVNLALHEVVAPLTKMQADLATFVKQSEDKVASLRAHASALNWQAETADATKLQAAVIMDNLTKLTNGAQVQV